LSGFSIIPNSFENGLDMVKYLRQYEKQPFAWVDGLTRSNMAKEIWSKGAKITLLSILKNI